VLSKLRGVAVTRPNQVWSTDITYVPMPHGFLYLTAVLACTLARCCGWSPGLRRSTRMLRRWKGRLVTSDRAKLVRKICPPPSPIDPSSSRTGWLMVPDRNSGLGQQGRCATFARNEARVSGQPAARSVSERGGATR